MTASRVYIGRLSHRARDRDVEKLFKSFGRIREIVLKNGYGFVEFEEYRDADDAVYELNGTELAGERIIVEHAKASGGGGRDSRDRGYSSRDRDYDRGYDRGYGGGGFGGGRGFRGRGRGGRDGAPVWLDKYGPPTRTDYRVKVDNLSSRTSWQDLKDYMRQAGEVTYADAHRPYKGEGVVEFATYSDMKAAVDKLDDTELGGKRIRVEEESKGGSRRRSSSRSRSRTRSRSRSRSRSRRTRSRSRSAKRSRSRSKSKSKSRSRSRSRSARRSASPPPHKSRSKSKSAPKRSRSRSGSRGSHGSRSRSRSK